MSFVENDSSEEETFKHIIRVLNTNLEGREKTLYAFTAIPGVGRRFAQIAIKKADIDPNKRAGDLTDEEVELLLRVIKNPEEYAIPRWMLNRQKDFKTGAYTQHLSNDLSTALREDLVRLKKIRAHRGIRHYWHLKVRGQHTKTTGRHGRTVGVSKARGEH